MKNAYDEVEHEKNHIKVGKNDMKDIQEKTIIDWYFYFGLGGFTTTSRCID